MRDYAKVSPSFWTGDTGKALRRRGIEAVAVGLYLMTSPTSNMLGLFYQPVLYMAHETGLGIEGASKGLRDCIEVGFCRYDDATEMVWVVEMAGYQIAPGLKATDKRCAGIQKDYDALPNTPFLGPWFDRYCKAFHLTDRRDSEEPEAVFLQAPSKPLPSKEKEKEKEKEEKKYTPSPSDLGVRELVAEGVELKAARDWLKARKAKKLPLTETAWDSVKREAAKAGMTPAEAVKHAAEIGWAGFKASWLVEGTKTGDVFAGAI